MKPHLELRAAELRARSTEQQRLQLWAKLERKLKRGELTGGEVVQAKREFWEARAADEIKVREQRKRRNHEAAQAQRTRRTLKARSGK